MLQYRRFTFATGLQDMSTAAFYPIGTPGTPWGETEKAQWLAKQSQKRSYADEVIPRIDALRDNFNVTKYGQLDYEPDHYPLYVLKSRDWDDNLPIMLVTGGVHGYEDSGVYGALLFAERDAGTYRGRANLVIVPCVSPWGYERIHRWNPLALDPNRNFTDNSPAQEARALIGMLEPLRQRVFMHIDLHETTDTDESEFRPALAARDGEPFAPGEVPDGFYLCGDRQNPAPEFQKAVIDAVAEVTHIAPSDANGNLIGSPAVAPGVIEYPLKKWGLCAGITDAPYRTTTEVYPDSPRATPEQCNEAQATSVRAAIDYALAHC